MIVKELMEVKCGDAMICVWLRFDHITTVDVDPSETSPIYKKLGLGSDTIGSWYT